MHKSIFLLTILTAAGLSAATEEYPGTNPGAAEASQRGATYTVSNEVLSADFTWKDGGVRFGGFIAPAIKEYCFSETQNWRLSG